MKKLTILFLLIFAIAKVYAQNYLITFAGTGASTSVDSVKVENLTQSTSLTIAGDDTLHLIGNVEINDIIVSNGSMIVFPNPMQGQSEVTFYINQAGRYELAVYDISGKEVLKTGSVFPKGTQNYRITNLKQGVYIVTVKGENYFYIVKLISINTAKSEARLEYLGNKKPETAISNLKSTKARVTMAYTTGDNLRFTGYSGTFTDIVTDIPANSKTITFHFVAINCPVTVSDIDGNNYNIIQIGTQCWMKENLKTSKYRNGTAIPNVTDNSWAGLSTGAYAWYNNDSAAYENLYGKLYNWFAAADARNICPTGWHVPTDDEWSTLATYAGGIAVAGKKLKSTTGWNYNGNGTDDYGFTGLPGGMHENGGAFFRDIGERAYLWTTTESSGDPTCAYLRLLMRDMNSFGHTDVYYKEYGFSVRCTKGDFATISTSSVTGITQDSAFSGGNIISDGGFPVTARGICWSTTPNPTLADSFTTDGQGIGAFTSIIRGITSSTTYYIRAYATNTAGTAYGDEVYFNSQGGLVIGNFFNGGIIVYIFQPGDPGYIAGETHGIVAAPSDQGTAVQWGCIGTPIPGADATAIGSGRQNTIDIIGGCTTAGIAAKLCDDLVLNGYSDWYLPSKDELNQLYINRAVINATGTYWSSSEYDDNFAWDQIFSWGGQNNFNKDRTIYVRAVRSF